MVDIWQGIMRFLTEGMWIRTWILNINLLRWNPYSKIVLKQENGGTDNK